MNADFPVQIISGSLDQAGNDSTFCFIAFANGKTEQPYAI